ncbi:Uncharacterised protein (plasmid) [Tsukamurella tyrosinosolvens]|uniref:Uncharacterized protein n=1 Tax=Tsukamurella tyrosinosolvens TaxID=57704 RepID=A0A1H4UCZ0_TSUTY|nr:hypothetical protein [Tsukamurella tyrosinosolvens]KXO92957.1 hypothetical protein AXK58_13890 [Tsukamurella tyrosinosolvens]SEC66597.1 hypothetical protein SAMN04489793_2859 [Tsukamurella tyrosinosolvens]VEH94140.1 Uncharacterised protein [Tsukamurella tyrosinosolvens]
MASSIPSSGAEYRALLLEPNWVANADPSLLRNAVHALCWAPAQTAIEAITRDPVACDKVLAVVKVVAAELQSRASAAAAAVEELSGLFDRAEDYREAKREHLRIKQRCSAALRISAACRAAAATAHEQITAYARSYEKGLLTLARAVADHRDGFNPDDATEADRQLWATLDEIEVPRRSAEAPVAITEVLALIDASIARKNAA